MSIGEAPPNPAFFGRNKPNAAHWATICDEVPVAPPLAPMEAPAPVSPPLYLYRYPRYRGQLIGCCVGESGSSLAETTCRTPRGMAPDPDTTHARPLAGTPTFSALATYWLARDYSRRHGRPLALAPDAAEWLAARPWPGNVRQLKHLVERSVLLTGKETLGAADFAFVAGMDEGARRETAAPPASRTLEELEREAIARCLERHGGNLSRAAEELGLSRGALYRRLEKYGIAP